MSKPSKIALKATPAKSDELPDALLDKIAGGGQQGCQTGEPVTPNRDEEKAQT